MNAKNSCGMLDALMIGNSLTGNGCLGSHIYSFAVGLKEKRRKIKGTAHINALPPIVPPDERNPPQKVDKWVLPGNLLQGKRKKTIPPMMCGSRQDESV
ncbi:MAG: hypothetical protein KGN35_07045 [Betaproteobacteria bacterium]|nr:hypothetical protein [Betaproteobacteria bacterium]